MQGTALAARAAALAFAFGANACAAPVSGDATAGVPNPDEAFRAAAATIAGVTRTLDDASTDGFIASSLAAGDPVSSSAKCLRPDDTVGTRTTPLTNRPFPPAAIEQRERLISVLEDYQALRAALASDGTTADVSVIGGDYRAALARFRAAAAVHGPGDLFVDEAAASLDPDGTASSVKALTNELNASSERVALDALLSSQHATIAKLIAVAFGDTSARLTQAEAATSHLAMMWQRYADAATGAKIAPAAGKLGTVARPKALPACGEPSAVVSATVSAAATDAASALLPPAIQVKYDAALHRHAALVALDARLGAYFQALARVNGTPADDTTAIRSAFDAFVAAALQLDTRIP